MSNKQARKLSNRLRNAEAPSPEDVALLGELLLEFNAAMGEVATRLQSLGLSPTTRLKTTDTIVDKLKRAPHLHLANIRDLAGARVVQRMTLDEQDAVAKQITMLWPDAQCVDRRENPSFGYRAVHLVPKIGTCQVEIQLRTMYQDTWAQVTELYGDQWGRDLRYGGEPDQPDVVEQPSGQTRRQIVTAWIAFADRLHELAKQENDLARQCARTDLTAEERAVFEGRKSTLDEDVAPLRAALQEIREVLAAGRARVSKGRVTP